VVGKICVESGISIFLLHAFEISWGGIECRENLAKTTGYEAGIRHAS